MFTNEFKRIPNDFQTISKEGQTSKGKEGQTSEGLGRGRRGEF
jgi:hypothetical protein